MFSIAGILATQKGKHPHQTFIHASLFPSLKKTKQTTVELQNRFHKFRESDNSEILKQLSPSQTRISGKSLKVN